MGFLKDQVYSPCAVMVFTNTDGNVQVKQVKLFSHDTTKEDMLLLNHKYFDYDCNERIHLIIDSNIHQIELKKNDEFVKFYSNCPTDQHYVNYKEKEWYSIEKHGHVTHENFDYYYINIIEEKTN